MVYFSGAPLNGALYIMVHLALEQRDVVAGVCVLLLQGGVFLRHLGGENNLQDSDPALQT